MKHCGKILRTLLLAAALCLVVGGGVLAEEPATTTGSPYEEEGYYTITIPTDVSVSETDGTGTLNITGKLEDHNVLEVDVSSANDYKLTYAGENLPYTITNGKETWSSNEGGHELTYSTEDSDDALTINTTLNVALAPGATATMSGVYTDTLTFTLDLVKRAYTINVYYEQMTSWGEYRIADRKEKRNFPEITEKPNNSFTKALKPGEETTLKLSELVENYSESDGQWETRYVENASETGAQAIGKYVDRTYTVTPGDKSTISVQVYRKMVWLDMNIAVKNDKGTYEQVATAAATADSPAWGGATVSVADNLMAADANDYFRMHPLGAKYTVTNFYVNKECTQEIEALGSGKYYRNYEVIGYIDGRAADGTYHDLMGKDSFSGTITKVTNSNEPDYMDNGTGEAVGMFLLVLGRKPCLIYDTNLGDASDTVYGSDGAEWPAKTNEFAWDILTDADKLPKLTRPGYTFGGWYTTAECNEADKVTNLENCNPTEDVTLYAKWTEATDTYTVKFVAGDGAEGTMNDMQYGVGESAVLPKCTFTRTDSLKFAGWSEKQAIDSNDDIKYEDGAFVSDWDNAKKDDVITLYAQWGQECEITVKYETMNSKLAVGSVSVGKPLEVNRKSEWETTKFTKVLVPGKTYTWTNPKYDSSNEYEWLTKTSEIEVKDETTNYEIEVWRQMYALDLNVARYDPELTDSNLQKAGGYERLKTNDDWNNWGKTTLTINGVVKSTSVPDYYTAHPYGTTYKFSDITVNSSYTFAGYKVMGWTLSSEVGTGDKIADGTPQVITHEAVDGEAVVIDKSLANVNTDVTHYTKTKPEDPNEVDGGVTVWIFIAPADMDTATGTEITLNGNNSTDESEAGTSTKTYTMLPSCTFTKTGYTFTSWNTKADGTGTSYKAGTLVEKITDWENKEEPTLYAQWRANVLTINYHSGGEGAITWKYRADNKKYREETVINLDTTMDEVVQSEEVAYDEVYRDYISTGNGVHGLLISSRLGWAKDANKHASGWTLGVKGAEVKPKPDDGFTTNGEVWTGQQIAQFFDESKDGKNYEQQLGNGDLTVDLYPIIADGNAPTTGETTTEETADEAEEEATTLLPDQIAMDPIYNEDIHDGALTGEDTDEPSDEVEEPDEDLADAEEPGAEDDAAADDTEDSEADDAAADTTTDATEKPGKADTADGDAEDTGTKADAASDPAADADPDETTTAPDTASKTTEDAETSKPDTDSAAATPAKDAEPAASAPDADTDPYLPAPYDLYYYAGTGISLDAGYGDEW